jgi:5-oxoprolinase (ATP-hydrolysing) subunit C
MIEVLVTPGLATVQDLGRFGSLRYGVGNAGAMDRMALTCANLLLGNEAGAAAIEVPLFPFSVRFREASSFALTGGGCAARLAGRVLLPWSVYSAEAGDELVLSPGRAVGSRTYLALPGGIDVPEVLGSRSTQLRGAFGGQCGRPLQAGDTLAAGGAAVGIAGYGVQPPSAALPLDVDGTPAVRVLPAAEYTRFSAASQAGFWAGTWKITAQSDRYGYRLAGEALAFEIPVEMLSHGIVPGVIQVPPSGQPIIQMRDAQPSGGYPKIGTVIEVDLWRLAQAPAGSRIHFIETDWAGALAAADAARAWLDDAGRLLELARSSGLGQRA